MEDKSEKRDMTDKNDENINGDNSPPENPDDQVNKDIPQLFRPAHHLGSGGSPDPTENGMKSILNSPSQKRGLNSIDIPSKEKADDEPPVSDKTSEKVAEEEKNLSSDIQNEEIEQVFEEDKLDRGETEESDFQEELEAITYKEKKRKKREDFWKKILLPYCLIGIGVFTLFKTWGIVTIPWVFVLTIDLVIVVIALRMSGILSPAWAVSLATIAALTPQYYIRSTYRIYIYLSTKIGTYPGDLWYCWNHYLAKNFPYPREYPSGIQMIFKFIYQIKPKTLNFDGYMIIICIFMGIFAILITYLLYGLVEKTHKKTWKIWVFWIFAPAFLWYALYNVDLISVFTIVLGYYLFTEEEYYLSAAVIALGTALKVFPIFMTPLLLFQCPKKKRLGSILTFVGVWVGFNLPFMLKDWGAWKYPYQWQIKHNFAKTARDGSFFWVIHIILNKMELWAKTHIPQSGFLWNIHTMLSPYKYHMGKVSLLIYAALYYLFLRKKWDLPLARKCAGIMMLFLLTDRIYSPQYHLYLLPFLVLVDYNFKKKIHRILFLATFYIAEIPNTLHAIFLFKVRHIEYHVAFLHNWLPAIFTYKFPYVFQGMMVIKYLAIIALFLINWYAPVNTESEDGGQMSEGGGQKSEVGGKKSEGGIVGGTSPSR